MTEPRPDFPSGSLPTTEDEILAIETTPDMLRKSGRLLSITSIQYELAELMSVVTPREIIELYPSISPATVYRWIETVPHRRTVGGGAILIRLVDVVTKFGPLE